LIVPGKPGILDDFVRVRIRSRDVIITPIKINSYIAENILVGTILTIDIEKLSAFSELIVALENKENKENKENLQILRVRITTYNLKKMKLSINKKVYIYIRSVSIDRQAYQYD
jgi:ABC-type molybdate transport system ATPase subunit